MKRIIIMGATSGIGRELALLCIAEGWQVGVAGRNTEQLEALRALAPERVSAQRIDITQAEAADQLRTLISTMGGMDIYFHSSGIGSNNPSLAPDIEIATLKTNGEGFVRMITAAFDYFRSIGGGHIAIISSIAGTKGLGSAPAYSATKRMQNTYIDALSQLSHMEHLGIRFTDIRPGFVATPLLRDADYPMLLRADHVARTILRAVVRQKRVKVIDRRYAVLVFLWRLIPEWLWERLPIRKKLS